MRGSSIRDRFSSKRIDRRYSGFGGSAKESLKMMNVDQADAIDNLMKQGFTRVQAIKIFYEQSLAKYYKKQYHGEDDLGFDQVRLMISYSPIFANLSYLTTDWSGEKQRTTLQCIGTISFNRETY